MRSFINEPGLVQIVTHACRREGFKVGDVLIPQEDGTVLCPQAGGWLEKEDVEAATKNLKARIHTEYYHGKIKKLKEEIEQYEAILRRKDETDCTD